MPARSLTWFEFKKRQEGMHYALSGGLWLHRHVYRGEPMAHLVSSDRERLLSIADVLGMQPAWLQYKPLKHPATDVRIPAWHWDLRGRSLELALRAAGSKVSTGVLSP